MFNIHEFYFSDPRKVSPPPVSSVGKIAVYGPMPPDKVSVEDICGPPIVCPECETEPKCRGESGVSLFDLIKTWEIRPYIEYKFNDSSFPNRTTGKLNFHLLDDGQDYPLFYTMFSRILLEIVVLYVLLNDVSARYQ